MYQTHGQKIEFRNPTTDPATIVSTPYTVFELDRYDDPELSNVANVLKWCLAEGYNAEIVFRDPHDENIDPSLWPLDFVFDTTADAIHVRFRWAGEAMWVFDFDS